MLVNASGYTTDEVAIVGSTDGVVYMIPYEQCIRTGSSPCEQIWSKYLGAPIYAPIRTTSQGMGSHINLTEGITYAGSSSDYANDKGGKLHALDTATGTILWEREARDRDNNSYSLRNAPAIDNTRKALINAYGPVLELLDLENGTVLATLDSSFTTAEDEFFSSPVVSLDADRIYIHSKQGYLWAINMTVGRHPELQVVYRCRYPVQPDGIAVPNCTWPGHWKSESPAQVESSVLPLESESE